MRNTLGWLMFILPPIVGCGEGQKTVSPVAPPEAAEANAAIKRSARPAASDTKPVQASQAEKKAAEPWGTLKGRIVWGDKKPPERGLVMIKEGHQDRKFCLKDGEVPEDNTYVVDPKNLGLKDAFVWLTSKDKLPIHPSLASPSEPAVTIDQPCCMFVPHAVALREGQVLVVKNSAKVLHNFKFGGLVNQGGNQSIAPGGAWEITDLKAERIPMPCECNFHPWMAARVGVFEHPYFAITDAQGNFEIKLAPAGSYQLMIWRTIWLGGAKGGKGRTIVIPPGGLDLGAIEFPPPTN
jgi:hypothetical protein